MFLHPLLGAFGHLRCVSSCPTEPLQARLPGPRKDSKAGDVGVHIKPAWQVQLWKLSIYC